MAVALNVDGACRGNPGPSAGGGCFKDSQGNVLLGFSYFYGRGPNIIAEERALLDGVRLAIHDPMSLSAVYSDSTVLVNLIRSNGQPPWSLLPWWQSLLANPAHVSCPVLHVIREGNRLADSLASYAVQSSSNHEIYSEHDLPCRVSGYARLDAIGLPSARLRRA